MRFHYRSAEQLLAEAEQLGLDIPYTTDVAGLARPVRIGTSSAPNALAIQPMEGCDGTPEGRPDELTTRRYLRFARGGAGLLWFEATAVTPEARGNPRQLCLTPETAPAFAALREHALRAAREAESLDQPPFTVLQLTHSGRYSRPVDRPHPVLAHHDGVLDRIMGIGDDYPLISDDGLDRLQDMYVAAAKLAAACGFDGVDIKSCHRYLVSELLAAHTRPGRYGGSFENRTRFLLSVVQRIREEAPHIQVTVRLNVFDGHPYPWGWGVNREAPRTPDLSEPLRLVRLLKDAGVTMINVTAGNPYFLPQINRPFDTNIVGGAASDEHPLCGVARLLGLARSVKEACPDLVVVSTGYSWLRQYLGFVAAGVVSSGWSDLAGVGREAFAYPSFARDLLRNGALDPRCTCIACSRCTQIMRDNGRAGCVPFDREIYGPIYDEGRSVTGPGR